MSVRASVMEIYRIIKELVKLNPFFKEQLQSLVELTDVNKPNELADMSAALTTSEGPKLQVRPSRIVFAWVWLRTDNGCEWCVNESRKFWRC